MKFSYRRAHVGNRIFLFLLVIVVLSNGFFSGFRTKLFGEDDQRVNLGKTKCVKIVRTFSGAEGIGALVRRTQLAFFVASLLDTKIDFPKFESSHGYAVQDMFSKCPEPEPSCILREETAALPRCPRGDCECLKRNIAPHLVPLTGRCSVINVENMKDRTMEYGGCISRSVERYLGMSHPPWEKLDYDALHYRAGDLADKEGGKAYSALETRTILKHMCLMSNRDIIIVTEGTPPLPVVPECGNRLVLAGNSTMKEAFGIFQHAKQVSLGTSSFAGLMAEVAQPERMVTVERAARYLEWMNCENWTVVSEDYSVFHFDSREMMVDSVIKRSLKYRSFHTVMQKRAMTYDLAVPPRRWSNDTSWTLARRTTS